MIHSLVRRGECIIFHEKADDLGYLDVQTIHLKMNDEQTKRLIAKADGCKTVEELQNLNKTRGMKGLPYSKTGTHHIDRSVVLAIESIGFIRKT